MDDRKSAAVRILASLCDVTHEKCFVLFPQKRMKITRIFCYVQNVSVTLGGKNVFVECSPLKYFIRLSNVV